MTQVEILFRYAGDPAERSALALGQLREVYGVRGLKVDRAAKTILLEYDATRLSAATVARLVRQCGLDLTETLPQALAPEPAPAA